jgi:Domain of unknown function (DUF4375)
MKIMATDPQHTLVHKCHDRIKTRIRQLGWENIAPEERHFENALAFYADVEGNGLDSIFFNSQYLGDMAHELLESLRAVAAPRAAGILERSFTYFPGGMVPVGLDTRAAILRQKGSREFFTKLGEEFYAHAEDRDETLYGYILAHAADFERLHGVTYRDRA